MLIKRIYDNLESLLEPNKVIVLYGPRRVGKTTLLKKFTAKTKLKFRFDTGEDLDVQHVISSQRLKLIDQYVADYQVIIIDEAQLIPNVGMGLKLIVDNFPAIKVMVTGSSSLDLSNKIGEPLVGRQWTKILYPVSQFELGQQSSRFDLDLNKEKYLIYGSYPEVLTAKIAARKRAILEQIVSSYLLKDILSLEKVKNPQLILKILKLLAFQIGSEVSLTEIGAQVGVDRKTVERYIYLLKQSFIIYPLYGYSRNLRKEIAKKHKYYFWDNGIRNAVIRNFNSLENRNDVGQLWENFLAIERVKRQSYQPIFANNYFWRTWTKQEVDWVEEREGKLFGFEFKWSNRKKYHPPKLFLDTYPNASVQLVTKENYLDFLIPVSPRHRKSVITG